VASLASLPWWRRELRDALWLSLVPVSVAVALGALLLPRRAVPDSVPLPTPDLGALARSAAADHALAEFARREPLPPGVRALGSSMRAYHTLEARIAREPRDRAGSEASALGEARQAIDGARIDGLAAGDDALLRLRAVQIETFLTELRGFEASGEESNELVAVGGSFVSDMCFEGWCSGHALLASDGARRALFKEMWNALVGVADRGAFRPPLDEERALYTLYLSRPHPPKAMRSAIAAAQRAAHDEPSCAALAQAERGAEETWRLERIERLAAIDPTYPAAYARGIASLRRGDFTRAAKELTAWLRDHPDGPLALRARSALRAAVADLPVE
jgi:hypothetical protein